jgi:hypothetical protein
MRRSALVLAVLPLMGCHTKMRVGSPQITRPPDIVTCIVVVDMEHSMDVMKIAAEICKDAIEEGTKK